MRPSPVRKQDVLPVLRGRHRYFEGRKRDCVMHWYDYLAHFVAGAFLPNGVPHFVQGICGNKSQPPFATPRGVGESAALVNGIWGWFNFILGGALLRIFFPPLP